MKIWVHVTWATLYSGTSGSAYRGTGTAFDTVTHLIENYSGDVYTALGEPAPQALDRAVGEVLDYECAPDFTKTSWVYDGGTATHTDTEANSLTCGYTPPLSCDLGTASIGQQATASGAKLTVSITGTSNGPLLYALDGGAEQASALFPQVAPGPHTVKLRDSGLAGCERLLNFEVAAPPAVPTPPAAPTGAPLGIDFVAQPLFYVLAGQAPGARVELALWAESSHYRGDYAQVLSLAKYADAQGRVSFRLDTLLLPLLSAFVPPPGGVLSQVTLATSTNLVNYYVRTTSLAPAAGALPDYRVSELRTALRGGLPAEWQDQDYFARRLSDEFDGAPFLSWQPAGPGAYAAGQAKPIVPRQPEWLCWLCPLEQASAQLRVRRAYLAAPGATPVCDYEPLTTPAGGWGLRLLAIPLLDARAGYAQLSVRVETLAGQPVSAEAVYRFVDPTPRTRFVLFTNSLGGLDTLRCEGRLEATLEATAESVELPPTGPVGRTPAADRRGAGVTASRKLRLTTGWQPAPEELLWLQDLVLAPEIWQQFGAQLRPLDWPKRSLAVYSDEPTLRGLVLDFDYAYVPTAYAPVPYA